MLTQTDINAIALSLDASLGETAIAAAVLRAQWASASGDQDKTYNWKRIAEQLEVMRASTTVH
ncbi:hypothetical protein [Fodinicurvata sp. EGI_FJ10296]|uniref:hypothetical protein n=1 Tax=Fodinicurvata sp. EGI_FJ10296 TaxID=3231908 RepID=UPI0034568992